MSTGRPTLYSEELAETICTRIASGESLNRICKSEGMPTLVSVYNWLHKDAAFFNKYAKAREDQADTLSDEILDIADEDPATRIQGKDEEARVIVDSAAVAHQRLRVDARKWVASKLKPKKYGEAQRIEMGGEIKNTNVQADQLAKLSEEELETFAKLMEKLSA